MNFKDKLYKIENRNNSLLCIGLDVDYDKIPKFIFEKLFSFPL